MGETGKKEKKKVNKQITKMMTDYIRRSKYCDKIQINGGGQDLL